MRLSNIPFRVESEAVQWWYRVTGRRPGSEPFLSGDGFRGLTPWRFEGSNPRNESDFSKASLIFCSGWHLKDFLETVGTQVERPFSVIVHNADPNVTAEILDRWPRNLRVLYSTNVLVSDPRVVPIPIGLENARLHYHGVIRDFRKLRKLPGPCKNRILVGFSVQTNRQVRQPALETLQRVALADLAPQLNSRAFRRLTASYRFVASPPGNGEDCHRTWEAMYLRVVPIVLRSATTESFLSLGLPLWIVDSYEELLNLTEDDLDRKYRELSVGFDRPELYTPYWYHRILSRATEP